MMIKKQLAELTRNFTEPKVGLKCWTENEKLVALGILREHYDTVEVLDGRQSEYDKPSWIIVCDNNKNLHESLNEADENVNDDLDLSDLDLDIIDDIGDVDDADQLTVLKKRASDLAEKWKETFKEISELAKKLDLVASHDDDLNIEVSKSNGNAADIDDDLAFINDVEKISKEAEKSEISDDIDDSFGPSEFDERATKLGPDVPIIEESKNSNQGLKPAFVNEAYPWDKNNGVQDLGNSSDPEELYLDPNRIDDDF